MNIKEVDKGTAKLKPQALMDDLAKISVKYNPDDVAMVTETPDGKSLLLECGSNSAGLEHIVNGKGASNFKEVAYEQFKPRRHFGF